MPLLKALPVAALALLAVFAVSCSSEKPETDNGTPWPTTALVDPNTAPVDALTNLPGLDSAAAQALIEGRPYTTASELNALLSQSMDEEALREVYKLMFIKVDLNNAAEDDLKLIPSSLSPRKFAHEIEEYRPYASMEQFQREMGKYVSDSELAYLERFVYLSE
ncbi:hypothetical protein [Parvularcula sp. IMCC14364]|uniref:hypothetical protein n=1 Tax=Parvularcula sp. IMCC14364 TaxID=3067902 RepID=UPI002741C6FC|nr:hypothetical protein [Parvularcula sp. IMCC14364]